MIRLKRYIRNQKIGKVGTVRIKYEGETFIFNLVSELKITRENSDEDIKIQPQAYGFLTMLHKKLIARAKNLEVDMNRVYSERYLYYMSSTKSKYYKDMGTLPNTTSAKELVMKDNLYLQSIRDYIKAEEERDTLEACVRAFEQRAFLLQTLSANMRKERN